MTPYASGEHFLNVLTGTYGVLPYTIQTIQLSGDASGPEIVRLSHPGGAAGIGLSNNRITLAFDEFVVSSGQGITLSDSSGRKLPFVFDSNYGVADGKTVVLKVGEYFAPGTYTLSVPRTSIHDLAGNQYSGVESFTFQTVQPVVSGSPGSDTLLGGRGSTIDGGAGIDVVSYAGISPDYAISTTAISARLDGKVDTLAGIERILFRNEAYAVDIEGNGGQAFRLYRAAFDRNPDSDGVGFWIAQLDNGLRLRDVAQGFVSSNEFVGRYGAASSDAEFVDLLYRNVLDRAADSGGYDFWLDAMSDGLSRAEVLVHFSESAENKAAVLGIIGNGFPYTPYY